MTLNNFLKKHHDNPREKPQKNGKSLSFNIFSGTPHTHTHTLLFQQGALPFYFALDPTYYIASLALSQVFQEASSGKMLERRNARQGSGA